MSGPRIIAGGDDDGFRLVRVEDGERVTHILETPDGCDALGVERWREVKINGSAMTALFGYLIKIATKQERA